MSVPQNHFGKEKIPCFFRVQLLLLMQLLVKVSKLQKALIAPASTPSLLHNLIRRIGICMLCIFEKLRRNVAVSVFIFI